MDYIKVRNILMDCEGCKYLKGDLCTEPEHICLDATLKVVLTIEQLEHRLDDLKRKNQRRTMTIEQVVELLEGIRKYG